jgi:hypothetical protein
VLATIALWRWRADPVVRFWSGVAIVAMVFAVGNDLRVAEVTFRLPVLRLLREPARHAFELTFAVGVLAGIGYDVLARAAAARRALILCAAAVPVLMLLTWAGIALTHPTLLRLAQQAGILLLPIGPVANPAIGIPVLIAAAAFGAVVLFATHPRSALARPLIFIVLAADVLSFAGCAYWRNSVSPSVIAAQADSDALSRATRASGQRIFAIRGGLGTEMQPNLSMMWGIAASGGYDPFVLKRVADLLDITPSGDTPHINADREPDTSLDITSTRYVVLPHTPTDLKAAAPWQIADLALDLSNRRALSLRDRYRFTFARPVPTTRVGLITALENSVDVRDGEHVADVVIDEGNRTITLPLLAGRDSAEIVYDDPSVRGNVKHRRATIFRTFAAERGHSYEAYFRLPARAAVRSVEIRWVDPTPASLKIEQGALIDDRTQQAVPFSALSLLDGRPAAWRDSFANGDFSVAENLHAFPRAWVASAVRALPPDQQLAAIHSGAFADGTPFDARHVALVDDPSLQVAAHPHSGGDVAYVSRRDDTSMTVQVGCAARCYVVTSDADYPGWQATVDGVATPVHLTDYALRGAVVPAGDHTLRFFYVPMRLYIGAAITVLSLMALVAVGLFGHRLERSIAKRRTVVSS